MKGYSPVELDRRKADGLPYATGADEPRHDWDDGAPPKFKFTGASGAGLPGSPMQPCEQAETDLLYAGARTRPEVTA